MSLLNPKDKDLPIIEHLIELRDRLVIAVLSIIVAIFVCFFYVNEIWAFLVAPLNDALANTTNGTLATTDVFEGMITQLKVAVLAGIVVASPMCFYQTWKYIFPALTITEARIILPVSFASTVLFLLGVAFGYYVIFDYVFPFALELNGDDIQAVLSVNAYLMTSTKLLLAFGVCFQLPIVTFVLARLGFIDHKDLFGFFRYAIVLILIISAILTPPDPLSQILMAMPLTMLYALGIVIAFMFSTKTREEEELPTESTPN